VSFGGGAMKRGVGLFGLISNINSIVEKIHTTPLNCVDFTSVDWFIIYVKYRPISYFSGLSI